ncbi:hypothetical protein ACFLYB_04910 [Chloroflexota bacterium]
MNTDALYHEAIPFPVARIVAVIMGCLSIMFLVLLMLQILSTQIGDNPPPNWMYLILSLVFIATTWLVYNFRTLAISIDQISVTVSYGRISYAIALDNIEAATIDTNPDILYGGWGIRMASIKGESALIYNVIFRPRVILKLKNGRFKQFAFSTRQPDEVIRLVHPRS